MGGEVLGRERAPNFSIANAIGIDENFFEKGVGIR